MFSNRFLGIKIGTVLVLIVLFNYAAALEYRDLYVPFWDCQSMPEHMDGWKISTGPRPVTAVAGEAFQIDDEGFTIWIKGAGKIPAVGDTVTTYGTFHKENYLLAEDARIHSHYGIKRGIAYGVSIAVVAIFVIAMGRVFTTPFRSGIVKEGGRATSRTS